MYLSTVWSVSVMVHPVQTFALAPPASWRWSAALTCPTLYLFIPCQHSGHERLLSLTSCVCTCLLILCSHVWERPVKVLKAVFFWLGPLEMPVPQGEMIGSMWPAFWATETAASPFGPASTQRMWAPFDGLIFWTSEYLTGHYDEN